MLSLFNILEVFEAFISDFSVFFFAVLEHGIFQNNKCDKTNSNYKIDRLIAFAGRMRA